MNAPEPPSSADFRSRALANDVPVARLIGFKKAEREKRIADAIDRVGLAESFAPSGKRN